MFPGHFYHVYNRGNHKQTVFQQPEDYAVFLEKWKKYVLPVAETWAYTLLPNHFHAVVRAPEEAIAEDVQQAFRNFFNSFSRVMQNRHGYTGSLFQRPFRKEKLETEERLHWCIGYVLTNITHHNAAADYRMYPWSSYAAMFSEKLTNIPRERLYGLFDGKENLKAFLENQAAYYGLTDEWEET